MNKNDLKIQVQRYTDLKIVRMLWIDGKWIAFTEEEYERYQKLKAFQ
jgi:hypothetical protein